jgi:hypothetical protein
MDDKSTAETAQGAAAAAREAADTGFERAPEYAKLDSDAAGRIAEPSASSCARSPGSRLLRRSRPAMWSHG